MSAYNNCVKLGVKGAESHAKSATSRKDSLKVLHFGNIYGRFVGLLASLCRTIDQEKARPDEASWIVGIFSSNQSDGGVPNTWRTGISKSQLSLENADEPEGHCVRPELAHSGDAEPRPVPSAAESDSRHFRKTKKGSAPPWAAFQTVGLGIFHRQLNIDLIPEIGHR